MVTLEQIKIKLSEAIKQSSLTQVQIAKALNVSQQTISHYLIGDKLPALDNFANLCIILDVDPSDILCIS